MYEIPRETVKRIREAYPAGCRVELVIMTDPYRNLPQGLQGTVACVDDTGTIHVNWDNGCRLGVIYGEDECRRISD